MYIYYICIEIQREGDIHTETETETERLHREAINI